MALRIDSATFHRNGSFGAGYYTVRFRHFHEGRWVQLGAVMFDAAEHCAILDAAGRSWRCEDFEADLRRFVDSPTGQAMVWPSLTRGLAANEA